MSYDFTTQPDRRGQGAYKWEAMRALVPEVPEGIVPLSVADMELKNAPEITEALMAYLRDGVLGYGVTTGVYRASVCTWMRERHGWAAEPAWIVTSPGVVSALYALVRAMTAPGDGVIVMPPVYHPFYHVVEETGRRIARCPLLERDGRYAIDFLRLEALAAKAENRLLLLCSPHNPGSRVWDAAELARISEICLRHGVFVVCDEIHHDLILPGAQHTVFATLGGEAAKNCAVCTAPTKTFNIAGLQCSNIFLPDAERRARFAREMKGFGLSELNVLGYVACSAAYTHAGAWLDAFLLYLAENDRLTRAFLAKRLPRVCAFPLEGTYLQWWDCRALGLPQATLMERLTGEAHFFVNDGAMFGAEGDGFVRVNLACPRATLCAALERVGTVLGEA